MNFIKVSFVSILFMLLAFAAKAQDAGIIEGRITDATSGEPLPGARVYVDSTNNGTVTDLEGNYELRVYEEQVTLKVVYLGYLDTKFPVTAILGATVKADIPIKENVELLEEVTVSGQLQGQAKALNQQKNADNIKNVISADQIGRFPDQNSAEALRRAPGVNTQNDQGEGRYVMVRGLAPQFTNINVNGEQIPSPEGDVRYVALDAISSSQLSSMEVYKTLTPDMDGDAIGGTINLITRKADSKELKVRGSLAGGYNQLMNKPGMNSELQIGKRFGEDEKFGLLVSGNYYVNNFGSDNWEREPFDNEFELRDYELTRTRSGLSATFDYKPGKASTLYLRTMYSGMTDKEQRRAYVFKPEDDEIERATKDRFEAQNITTVNVGGEHKLPKINIDYEVQYSLGVQDTPYDNEAAFIAGTPSNISYDGDKFPTLEAPGYLDNSTYEMDVLEFGNTLARDQNVTAKFNIGLPYQISGQEGLFKFGAKVRMKNKSYDVEQNKVENRGGVPTLDNFEGGTLDNKFLQGNYTLANPLEVSQLINYYNTNPQQFELQIEDKAADEALEAYEATENVYAGYVMSRQRINKLVLIGGVRYELTQVDYKSKDVVFDGAGDLAEIRDVEGSKDYGYILPQLNAKYELSAFTNLRAAATYSYSRPNFGAIIPSQEANIQDREATVGNPELNPVSAINLDLMIEKYFGNVGVVSGGLYYKKLDDFIYNKIIYNGQYPLVGTPIATNMRITQAQNGEAADIYGLEASFQRKLDFLPGFLKPLTLYLNYTYTHSDSKIQSRNPADQGTGRTESIRLPGQASNIGNVSLAYQGEKLNLRLSMLFNGKYIDEIGGSPEEDIWISSRMQLDASASYRVAKQITVFTEFLNLTNQPYQAYAGSEDVVIQSEYYSWWMRFGVNFNLSKSSN